jgi:hypothetical protein
VGLIYKRAREREIGAKWRGCWQEGHYWGEDLFCVRCDVNHADWSVLRECVCFVCVCVCVCVCEQAEEDIAYNAKKALR